MKFLRALILSLVAGSVVYSCASTPGSGRRQLVLLPESQMNAMGIEAYGEIKAKEQISSNKELTAEIVEIGKRIAVASGESNYEWEFTLFDSEQVNAFCLPGGKIGVYTGMIPMAKTNAGLAAVLSHEVAHAIARHSNERVSQNLVVTGVLIGAQKAFEDNRYRGGIMAALGLGAQFGVQMPYSRAHETEADLIGLRYMAEAGYDPREAAALWERMGKSGGQPPEILSTHPNPSTRVKAIRAVLDEVMPIYEASKKIPTTDL